MSPPTAVAVPGHAPEPFEHLGHSGRHVVLIVPGEHLARDERAVPIERPDRGDAQLFVEEICQPPTRTRTSQSHRSASRVPRQRRCPARSVASRHGHGDDATEHDRSQRAGTSDVDRVVVRLSPFEALEHRRILRRSWNLNPIGRSGCSIEMCTNGVSSSAIVAGEYGTFHRLTEKCMTGTSTPARSSQPAGGGEERRACDTADRIGQRWASVRAVRSGGWRASARAARRILELTPA